MTDPTVIPPAPAPEPVSKLPLTSAFETRTFIVCWMMISSFALVVLCWWKPPAPDNQIINTLIGIYVSTGFVTALQWWMGSSKGSDEKTKALVSGINGGGK